MGAPGLTSPIRAQGFKNLQLNAGVFVKNANVLTNKYDIYTLKKAVQQMISDGTNILGMTSGGGTFTLAREMRLPDVDGRRYLHKGAHFVDSMDAYISGTLVEITPENWKTVIGTTEPFDSNTASKAAYKVKTMLNDNAYESNIAWVGDLADGRFAIIKLENVLNTTDITFTFQDKNEGKLPFELHAHQSGVNVYDRAPVSITFFNEEYTWVVVRDEPVSQGVPASGTKSIAFDREFPAGTYEINDNIITSASAAESRNLIMKIKHNGEDVLTYGISDNTLNIPAPFDEIEITNNNTNKQLAVQIRWMYRTGDAT